MALTPIEEIRLLVGDNNPNYQILSDDEIQYFLDKYSGSVTRSSVDAARSILFQLASLPTKEVTGDIEVSNDWANSYRKALELFVKDPNLSLINFKPYAGGISKSDMRDNDSNNDNVRPSVYTNFGTGKKVYNQDNCIDDDSSSYGY